ncbi:MAG: 16S rRNA (guanine(966)-N(2))-methyltransferase RsmD [Bacteroidia bacterium]
MRIIGGKFKGHRFPSHKLNKTRPTTDRAKESLMNILSHQLDLDGAVVLDLYSGTGNIAFEFISRGAEDVTVIEANHSAISYIKAQANSLDVELNILKSQVLKALPKLNKKYDLIFADPPYNSPDYELLVSRIFELGLLKEGGQLIVEHDSARILKHKSFRDSRQYGQSTFSFFTFELNEQ